MRFTLTIELGNAAMSKGFEIAEALETAAHDLRAAHDQNRGCDAKHWDVYDRSHGIKDENGNTAGHWEVTE